MSNKFSISIKRVVYRGHDQRKRIEAAERNHDAAALESHLREEFSKGRRGYYHFSEISGTLGWDAERVAKALRCPQAGHNGVWLNEQQSAEHEEA